MRKQMDRQRDREVDRYRWRGIYVFVDRSEDIFREISDGWMMDGYLLIDRLMGRNIIDG